MAFQEFEGQDQQDPFQIVRQRTMRNLQPNPTAQPAGGGFGGGGGLPASPVSPRQQQYGITPGAAQNVGGGFGASSGAPPGPFTAQPFQEPGRTPPPGVSGPFTAQPVGGQQPTGAFNYEGARDAWMSGQFSKDEAGARQWAQQYGIPYQGGDVINLPNGGGQIDILGNFKSGRNVAANWTPVGGNGPNPGGQGGAAAFGGGGAAGGAGGAGGGFGGDFQGQLRQMLMQQLGGLAKPISADDPTIAGELQAQERGLERNRQQRRAAMAERMAAEGLNSGGAGSGALSSEIASGFEDKGAAMSGLRSQLFGRELQNRRQQLSQMMGMALQTGDAESARALQFQLAQMDNEIRRMGLSQQASQFGQSLGEQQRQFNDQFGLQGAQFQYGKDRDLALFGAGG